MPTVNAAESVTAATNKRQQVLSLQRFGGTEGFELVDRAMPTPESPRVHPSDAEAP